MKMKKWLAFAMTTAMVSGLLMGCGTEAAPEETSKEEVKQETADQDEAAATEEAKKAILIVNGSLGDLGFFDSANRGMLRLKEELGMEIQVIETGDDESKWEPALADAAEEEVDYVIAVSPSMVEPVQKIAPMYEDKVFILIDNAVDFEADNLSNVYCATFKQNEGSFLAGVAGAILAKEEGKMGFVGGMDIPPINDFLVGYIEGALAINSESKIIATYPGDYYDPAKGKEHGIVMANQGVEVMFAAAGPTGLGVIEAAKEKGKLIVGVDSDQSAGYAANGDNETAEIIATSMLKNVGDAIFRAIELHIAGNLPMGTAESLGIAEGGVGLAKNEVYEKSFTAEEKAVIEEMQKKVVSGEIKVSSAIGMTNDELSKLKESVAP